MFLVDKATVRRIATKYSRRRLFSDWIAAGHRGTSGKLTRDEKIAVGVFVDDNTVTDVRQVVVFIKNEYDKKYSVAGVTKLLKRLGFVYKNTTLIPGKLDEEAQAKFVREHKKTE
jgi:transposase